jgi:transcription termination factor Rho
MPVLQRDELASSPLADLHAIASELGLDGYRRLRKAELVEAILAGQGSSKDADEGSSKDADASSESQADEGPAEDVSSTGDGGSAQDADEGEKPRRRSRRGGRRAKSARASRDADADRDTDGGGDADARADSPKREERRGEGTIEVLGNGSAFLRVAPPEPSDDDVYVSAGQVRRCELVSGDHVTGPVRAPRRSERYASLVRVETINAKPADEVADGTRFDDLPAAFASRRLELGAGDPTLEAIDALAPVGLGSRVAIVGPARAGKTETLRRIARALADRAGGDGAPEVSLVLAGVRPEETADWPLEPVATGTLTGAADAQGQTVERALDTAQRVAARGGDAVVLIDTLDGVPASVARRALQSARNLVEAGTLTVVATATQPLGGETTVVALDRELAARRRFPAVDPRASGTLRAELLVGEEGVEAIARAIAEAD